VGLNDKDQAGIAKSSGSSPSEAANFRYLTFRDNLRQSATKPLISNAFRLYNLDSRCAILGLAGSIWE